MESFDQRDIPDEEKVPLASVLLMASSICLGFIAYGALQFDFGSKGKDRHVLLIFPPTWSQGRSLFASSHLDVDLVSGGRMPFTTIVAPRAKDFRVPRGSGVLATLPIPDFIGCGRPAASNL